jgi:adenine-specific DNA-methyltransferase
MDRLRQETADGAAENVRKIAELFPQVVSEGRVDFDALRALLGDEVFGDEAYEFTWVGKREAVREAGRPIRKTLRPCVGESRNWDSTENLYIEGDNLDVLKLLQESYLGKVKMIYIDPPYNTGNDFVYRDDFAMERGEYDVQSGAVDRDDNRLFRNTESNGRFHSDWCSMIYPRLSLARNMLSSEGSIFISIDDNEIAQLRKICDEVFGEANFVAQINWKGRGGRQDSKYYAAVHEYILCYAKSILNFCAGEEIKSGDVYPKYDGERKRNYKTQLLRKWGSNSRRDDRPNLYYPITAPDGSDVYPMISAHIEGCWRWGSSTMKKAMDDGNIEFVKQSDGSWIPYEKIYAPSEGEEKTKKYTTWIEDANDGASVLKDLFKSTIFDYPKTPKLLEKFMKMAHLGDGDIILDFFSGSATTAHAVMQLNAEDGGKRKFIMVQLPEECAPDSEAAKAGYRNICEIGKERIRRAGDKIRSEAGLLGDGLDIGFRVLKLDDTNMRDVYYAAGDYTQDLLDLTGANIKEGRTDMDLLYGCLLEWGLPLSMPHAREEIDGAAVHTYNGGDLIACFSESVSDKAVREIAGRQPLRAVFRDSGFADSPSKINVEEIFKLLSPNTKMKVM